MSFLTLSEKHNPNYLAKIVRIKNLRKHCNADRLLCSSIDGFNVIVGLETKLGDLGVFFPAESQISEGFLKANSLFKNKELNFDKTKSGFFDNRRVKNLKLRGEKSEGFYVPIDYLAKFSRFKQEEIKEDQYFDTVGGALLVKKYFIREPRVKGPQVPGKPKKIDPNSVLIPKQFNYHIDTPQLGRNIWKIEPQSWVTITQKLHGTSFIVSKVLTKRKLSWVERIAKFFGSNVVESEYRNLYASRAVIKNLDPSKKLSGFYKEDIWGVVNQELQEHLEDGLTLYGEIVGFCSDQREIQKGYDYGCEPGTHRAYIYRATWTLPSGVVIEVGSAQLRQWCDERGLLYVPVFFSGKASELFPFRLQATNGQSPYRQKNNSIEEWQGELLEFLKATYLEKKCWLSKNDVWDEGIVVRRDESSKFDVFKLKSFNFNAHESQMNDKGEVDMETIESLEDEDIFEEEEVLAGNEASHVAQA